MSNCEKCQAPLPEGKKFCPNCGYLNNLSVSNGEKKQEQKQHQNNSSTGFQQEGSESTPQKKAAFSVSGDGIQIGNTLIEWAGVIGPMIGFTFMNLISRPLWDYYYNNMEMFSSWAPNVSFTIYAFGGAGIGWSLAKINKNTPRINPLFSSFVGLAGYGLGGYFWDEASSWMPISYLFIGAISGAALGLLHKKKSQLLAFVVLSMLVNVISHTIIAIIWSLGLNDSSFFLLNIVIGALFGILVGTGLSWGVYQEDIFQGVKALFGKSVN